MENPDVLAVAIRDKQVRYRHEAYQGQLVFDHLKRRVGTHLIHVGEAIRGQVSQRFDSPGIYWDR
jgi:hypothetical protein